ncbi:MAG: sigma-70 family RNA polymerase sigma factor [Planctomycetes bacterium]|nr:sigma-70 family RNA polymerase sigma factor [Planctomycetota bacterium]
MDPREADLVVRFQKGDDEAAAVLVKRYAKLTAGLIYSHIGRVQDADDLLQDVFLEAQKSIGHIRNPDRFSSWLYKITRRVCNRWLRDHRRAPVGLEEPEEIAGPAAESADSAGQGVRIRHAVDAMPKSLREVIYMRYFESLSYERMGEVLGISASAVNARLLKARRLLRKRWSSGIDSEPGAHGLRNRGAAC